MSSDERKVVLFINNLIEYENVDSTCAEAAIKAFSGHMWYLTEELVPLAFSCTEVEDMMKQKMADKLLKLDKRKCRKRLGTGFWKPCFPDIPESQDLDLSKYIGEDSWTFFDIIKLDIEFLSKPVQDW